MKHSLRCSGDDRVTVSAFTFWKHDIVVTRFGLLLVSYNCIYSFLINHDCPSSRLLADEFELTDEILVWLELRD